MKKIFALSMLVIACSEYSNIPPLPDIQNINSYHTQELEIIRLPEFIIDLYSLTTNIISDIANVLITLPETIKQFLFPTHPYINTSAAVRWSDSDDICNEEKTFIENRIPLVKQGIQKFLQIDVDETDLPRIGMAFSGGGFRAMITTLGFLASAKESGLLDATLYMAGVSGATWAIGPWIASGKSIQEYTDTLHEKIEYGIDHINDPYELKYLFENLLSRLAWQQYVSIIDIYGAMIANTLMKELDRERMRITLTQAHQGMLTNNQLPLPIYTAITTNTNPYEWLEVTPFEVGLLKSYIPTWAYGRKFKNGQSLDYAPEQPLGYYLGIFGSAFEVNFSDILHHTAGRLQAIRDTLPTFLQKPAELLIHQIKASSVNDFRLFPSMLNNFTYHYMGPLQSEEHICLIDAGIDFNLPVPPLLRAARNLDTLIIYDSSSKGNAKDLKYAEKYARRRGIKFPEIDLEKAIKNIISIFNDPQDPEVPTIIYFPMIKNEAYSCFNPVDCVYEDYCNTFNFTYNQQQIKELCGLPYFCLNQESQSIIDLIKEKQIKVIQSELKKVIQRKRNMALNKAC